MMDGWNEEKKGGLMYEWMMHTYMHAQIDGYMDRWKGK